MCRCRASPKRRPSRSGRARSWASPGSSARGGPSSSRASSACGPPPARSRSRAPRCASAPCGDSLAAGIAYVTEDRKGKGLLLRRDLRSNLTLAALQALLPRLPGRRGARGARGSRTRSDASTSGCATAGRWRASSPAATSRSCCSPRCCSASRASSWSTSRRAASTSAPRPRSTGCWCGSPPKAGPVVVISSEMAELIGLCHRILVMREGRIVGRSRRRRR